MRDDDIHALFERARDDGPPLGIDVRQIMTRGRRIRTRRAALGTAGGVLAVAIAVAVGLSGPRPPGVVRPADPPAPPSTSVPSPPRPAPYPDSPTRQPGPESGPPHR